jgi:hypothetical protein
MALTPWLPASKVLVVSIIMASPLQPNNAVCSKLHIRCLIGCSGGDWNLATLADKTPSGRPAAELNQAQLTKALALPYGRHVLPEVGLES